MRHAKHRWAPFVVALLVSLPSVTVGFAIDDWYQRSVLRGEFPMGGPLDLFTFADGHLEPFIRKGPFPWFTLPEVKLSFFRPLASLLVAFDFYVFGEQAWLGHLHSIAWYLALVAVVTALYRRLLGPLAWLAALVFALDDAHSLPVDWLANRNALVATTFAWAGLLAHLRYREDGWAPGRVLCVLGFVLGLSTGETTISASAYLVAYELIGRRDAIRTRLLALLPTGAVLFGFIILYRAMHSGAYGSGTYVDPIREPLSFLAVAPARFCALVGGWSFGALQEAWLFAPFLRGALIACGAITLAIAPFVWRWATAGSPHRSTLAWLALGSVGAILPGLATFPSSRLMTAPSFGLAALVAVMAHAAFTTHSRPALAYLAFNFAFLPMVTWVATPLTMRALARAAREGTVEKPNPPLTGKVVILSAGDFVQAFFGVPLLAESHRPAPQAWHVLSLAPFEHRLTRTAEDTFELEVMGGAMMTTIYEENVRGAGYPLPAGTRVELEDLTVTVLADDAGKPTRIGVRLHQPQSAYQFVTWAEDRFAPAPLPQVGESQVLPRVAVGIEAFFAPPNEPIRATKPP